MHQYFITFVFVVGALMVLDALWLGIFVNSLYRINIGHLIAD